MTKNWYVTFYRPDLMRVTTGGEGDLVWNDETLATELLRLGICHMGRTTTYSPMKPGDTSPVSAQVWHLDDGRWLSVQRFQFPWDHLTTDAQWPSSCPKACFHPNDGDGSPPHHVIHQGSHH